MNGYRITKIMVILAIIEQAESKLTTRICVGKINLELEKEICGESFGAGRMSREETLIEMLKAFTASCCNDGIEIVEKLQAQWNLLKTGDGECTK